MSETTFINPAPYGDFKYESQKVAELSSSPNTKIVSPYEGIVVFDQTPNCRNYIKIKHMFDENIFYSVFCDVENINVSYGEKVKQGAMIGKFSDDKIKFYIVDDKDSKQQLSNFFSKKLKRDKEKKSDKTTTKTTTQKPKLDTEENPNPFMDILLSPFSLATHVGKEIKKDVKNLFSKKKKDDDKSEDKDNLNEEIVRIKKLMK